MTIAYAASLNPSSEESTISFGDSVSFDVIIRSILISRAQLGASIQEIRDDYFEHTGEKFPISENIRDSLLKITGVACYQDRNGTYIFNIERTTEKTQHILDMVRKQKPPRKQSSRPPKNMKITTSSPAGSSSGGSSDDLCYFKDNYRYINRHEQRSNLGAQLYDYQLLGDDYFLSVARMELNCQFTPGHRIYQSGVCVSGQTISDARNRIELIKYLGNNVILNIGSVDILHGHDLMDIKHDFLELMETFRQRGITPIVTTLAPLANYYHKPNLKRNLERFNDFLRKYWPVIDLWSVMVNQHGQTLYECYQAEARYVSGSNQPHVLWNKIGRQRILKYIKTRL